MSNENEKELAKGFARVHIAGGKTVDVPIDQLDQYVADNQELVMNSHYRLRERIRKAHEKEERKKAAAKTKN